MPNDLFQFLNEISIQSAEDGNACSSQVFFQKFILAPEKISCLFRRNLHSPPSS